MPQPCCLAPLSPSASALCTSITSLGKERFFRGSAIPVYDGPTISCLVFAALLGFSYGEYAFAQGAEVVSAGVVGHWHVSWWRFVSGAPIGCSSRSARLILACAPQAARHSRICLGPVQSSAWPAVLLGPAVLHTAAKLRSHPERPPSSATATPTTSTIFSTHGTRCTSHRYSESVWALPIRRGGSGVGRANR